MLTLFSRHWLNLSLLTLLLLLLLGVFLQTELRLTDDRLGVPLDDAWIHYQFARTLAQGDGFSYNPGEPTPGSTAPLWTLMLAGVGLFTTDLLIPSLILSALFLLLTVWLTYGFTWELVETQRNSALSTQHSALPMLTSISIKSLYPLALAEGEGVGTAYEYYAKRLLLSRFLRRITPPKRILVAGLPDKYGSSLDFLFLAEELNAEVVVAEHRPAFLEKGKKALAAAQQQNLLQNVSPHYVQVTDPVRLSEVAGSFDLAICCEVLQSLPVNDRTAYWRRLRELAPAIALFTPNAGNPAHSKLSGLRTVSLDELKTLTGVASSTHVGLADLPPFPSGVTRSAEQREQATTGTAESFVMWGLNIYARLEPFLPLFVRQRYTHMVYALAFQPRV